MKVSKASCLVALLIVVSLKNVYALERTPTGFYYPTGRAPISGDVGWLASDDDYYDNFCHIGHDFYANVDDLAYPISDGEIYYISYTEASWGSGNMGVFVKHLLADNTPFLALYAHVKVNSIKSGDSVFGGISFAKIGWYSGGVHLHLGIFPGLNYPSTSWGRIPSPGQYPYNGFVDPINWINTKTPAPMVAKYPNGTTNNHIFSSYTANGGSGRFGTPWNNSSFGAYVHPWPDNPSDPNVVWLQDFIELDGHWWQIVDNPAAGQAFPVHGQMLAFWHANYGYTNYGAPKSNEYYATHESNGHQLVVQTFVKGSTVHYLGYDTVAETSKEGRKRNI